MRERNYHLCVQDDPRGRNRLVGFVCSLVGAAYTREILPDIHVCYRIYLPVNLSQYISGPSVPGMWMLGGFLRRHSRTKTKEQPFCAQTREWVEFCARATRNNYFQCLYHKPNQCLTFFRRSASKHEGLRRTSLRSTVTYIHRSCEKKKEENPTR